MKLFTVGPVEMDPRTRELGNIALPYFRTPDFSKLMFELERNILELIDAPSNARAVLLTASGSGAMESAVVSVFNRNDKLLIINGGTFGRRFADICAIHRIPYTEIHVPFERDLILSDLEPFAASGYTGLLIQGHETSIGKQYDLKMVGDWCERQGLLLVADCVSSFLTDEFSMRKMNVDVFFTASQKALALPPGLSIVSCSERVLVDRLYAPERVRGQLYLDLHDAFVNAERGQTPFTPALSIILQLDDRLKRILAAGGDVRTGTLWEKCRLFSQAGGARDAVSHSNLSPVQRLDSVADRTARRSSPVS